MSKISKKARTITRSEAYRQRILGPQFARQTFVKQDDAARLSSIEFVLYVISFLIWPLYYVGERIRVQDAFEVNRVLSNSFHTATYKPARALSYRTWQDVDSLRDVQAYLAQALPRAITSNDMNAPITPLRLSTRRIRMENNADTENFAHMAPKVWSTMVGVEATSESTEFDDVTAYGKHQKWKITNASSPKIELEFNFFTDKTCVGGRELDIAVQNEPLETCKRLCGLYRCGCMEVPKSCRATASGSSSSSDDSITCSYCRFRAYGQEELWVTSTRMSPPPLSAEWIPPQLASTSRDIYVPTLMPFQYAQSRGYSSTSAFVELLQARYPESVSQLVSETRLLELILGEHVTHGGFVDRYTSSLTVDFVTENENVGLYTWVQLIFEFNVAGSVQGTIKTDTLDLTATSGKTYTEFGDGFLLQYDDKFTLAVLCFWTVKTLQSMLMDGPRKWLSTIWNWMMLANLALFAGVLITWVSFQSAESAAPKLQSLFAASTPLLDQNEISLSFFEETMTAFQTQADYFLLFQRIAGFAFFFQYLNLLSYLRIASPRVGILMDMISRSSTALVCFSMICFILFLGFVNFSNIQFGTSLPKFGSQSDSFVTLFSMMGGKIDVYNDLVAEFPIRSRVFFLIFMLLFYFILVNLNNAILNAAYVDAVRDAEELQKLKEQRNEEALLMGQGDDVDDDASELDMGEKLGKLSAALYGRMQVKFAEGMKNTRRFLGLNGGGGKGGDEDEDGLTTKCLYALFVVIYFMILYLALQRDASYEAGEAIKETLEYTTFPSTSSGGQYVNFNGIGTRDDVLTWMRTGLKYALFESSRSLPDDSLAPSHRFLDKYHTAADGVCGTFPGSTGCRQLVLRNWNVILGQNPVRLSQRLYPMDSATKRSTEYRRLQTVSETDVEFSGVSSLAGVVNARQRAVLQHTSNYTAGFNEQAAWVASFTVNATEFDVKAKLFDDNYYLTAQSANLVIEFLVFNAQLNIFSLAILSFTFPPAGGVRKDLTLKSLPLEYYNFSDVAQTMRMILELIYVIYLIYYIVEECIDVHSDWLTKQRRMLKRKIRKEAVHLTSIDSAGIRLVVGEKALCFLQAFIQHFCLDLFNFVDLVSYLLSLTSIVLWTQLSGDEFVSGFVQYENPTWEQCDIQAGWWCSDGDVMTAFYVAAKKQDLFVATAAVNVIFIFFRLLKFFRNAGRMRVIFQSLQGGFADIIWFFLLFFVIFWGFTLTGHLFFGTKMGNFSSVEDSVLEVYEMVLGQYSFSTLAAADATMAPVFFFPFLILFYYILMNVFFAVMDKNFQHFDKQYSIEQSGFLGRSVSKESDDGGGGSFADGVGDAFASVVGSASGGGAGGPPGGAQMMKGPGAAAGAAPGTISNKAQVISPAKSVMSRNSYGINRGKGVPAGYFSTMIKEDAIKDTVTPYWLLLPQDWKDWSLEQASNILADLTLKPATEENEEEEDVDDMFAPGAPGRYAPKGDNRSAARGGNSSSSVFSPAGGEEERPPTAAEIKELEHLMMGQLAADMVQVSNLLDKYLGETLPHLDETQQDQNVLAQYIEMQEQRKRARLAQLQKVERDYDKLLQMSKSMSSQGESANY
mmetsp:Transcript_3265/g.7652  ORF Transcript_3265/g.7652 Transcript_3265/m.7652 type:complete len:1587 (+) Transcript_3265:212-4972(+)